MAMAEQAKAAGGSFHTLTKRQIIGTMTGVMLTLLLAALDQTIVGTAMPRIIADLQGFEHYAWVTTAYLLTSTAVVPIVGNGDAVGREGMRPPGRDRRRTGHDVGSVHLRFFRKRRAGCGLMPYTRRRLDCQRCAQGCPAC